MNIQLPGVILSLYENPLKRKAKEGNFNWRRCPGGHAHLAWGFEIKCRTLSYLESHQVREQIRNFVFIIWWWAWDDNKSRTTKKEA